MLKLIQRVVGLLILMAMTVTAQIPRTLQIAITNGTVKVASQNAPGYFLGQLQTTSNLSASNAWMAINPYVFEAGESDNFSATNPQQFYRLSQRWPVFDFAIFYELNMEIDPGSLMLITGPVFSNAGIWVGSPSVTFYSTVSAAGQVYTNGTDPFLPGKTDSGGPVFLLTGQPTSGNLAFSSSTGPEINPESILTLPPPAFALGTPAAYSANGQFYLANAVDLIITNFASGTNAGSHLPTGTNILVCFQDSGLFPVPYDFFWLTNRSTRKSFSTNYVGSDQITNEIYAGYSFLTNVLFYDAREGWNSANLPYGKPVQAVQFDVSKFNLWLTNSAAPNNGVDFNNQNVADKGHGINSIYVYSGVPVTASNLTAVRVVNGARLPSSGFTVVTPFPIYVLGNYNITGVSGVKVNVNNQTVGYTYPAALMGDAVTILSANWTDALHSKGVPVTPTATTVNAACLEGIVESAGSNYSGGVENFLRLLENWTSSIQLTYNGSVVVMFPSFYATNYWNGGYYGVPKRAWAFDTNFWTQTGLPPLTPSVINSVTH